MTNVAILSKYVFCLLITTRYLPLKYFTKLLAGYTVSDVPPTISISALDIKLIDFDKTLSSNGSSYKTTSGFIIPPQSHIYLPLNISIASIFLLHLVQ